MLSYAHVETNNDFITFPLITSLASTVITVCTFSNISLITVN